MGDFIVIRPKDDAAARRASNWCDDLSANLIANGHNKIDDLDDHPGHHADRNNIFTAIQKTCDLICYFGHGTKDSWTTSGAATLDASNVTAANGKAVVSVACRTSQNLGPDAITAGAICWLGFTTKVPVAALHKTRDPFGEAIVAGLSGLGNRKSMQEARDDIYANLKQVADDFDTGSLSSHWAAALGYLAALHLKDHIVVNGNAGHRPL